MSIHKFALANTIGMCNIRTMEKLDNYIKDRAMTRCAFAKAVGCAPSTLTEILQGKYLPSLEIGVAIEQFTRGKVKCVDMVPPKNGGA